MCYDAEGMVGHKYIYMVTCSFTVFHGFWINNRSIDTVLYDTMLLFFLAGFLNA